MEHKPAAILTAAVLGTAAFNAGKTRVPCLDRQLMEEIGRFNSPDCQVASLMLDAWLEAWDNANLVAALPKENNNE